MESAGKRRVSACDEAARTREARNVASPDCPLDFCWQVLTREIWLTGA